MEVEEATAKFLEDWGLVLFGLATGTVGALWLVVEELHYRRTAEARRHLKMKRMLGQLVKALEVPPAKDKLDQLRMACATSAAFETAKSDVLNKVFGPIYMQHQVNNEWFEAVVGPSSEKDPEIAQLVQRLGKLVSFGLLGPLELEKGSCVAIDGLEGEAACLNGERGVIKGYSEETEKYDVAFLLKDAGPMVINIAHAHVTHLGTREIVVSIQEQILKILREDHMKAFFEAMRNARPSRSLYLHRREGLERWVLSPIIQRHGVERKWFTSLVGVLSAAGDAQVRDQAEEIESRFASTGGEVVEELPEQTNVSEMFMPDDIAHHVQAPAERSRVVPRAGERLWEVVAKEGLRVMTGSDEAGWRDLPARLEEGALLRELVLDDGYVKFEKVTGKGPASGWLDRGCTSDGTLLPGVATRPREVWLLCLVSRQDFRHYAALAQGLQRAGYAVRVYGHSGLEALADALGLPFSLAAPDIEEALRLHDGQPSLRGDVYGRLVFGAFDHRLLMHDVGVASPDLLLHTELCYLWAWNVERRFGVPAVAIDLQPRVLDEGELSEEGRGITRRDSWEALSQVEEAHIRPHYDVAAITDMGFESYFRRSREQGRLVGFLADLSESLHMLPWHVQEVQRRHSYTGFWLLEPNTDPVPLPSADQQAAIERFLAFGPAVYLGWGPCTCKKGPHHMVDLAVGALKRLGIRGIVASGQAGLNLELLAEAVSPEDRMGLCKYAQDNVLFLTEDVPLDWLLPQCVCHVHQGSPAMLAASWQTGRSVIVTPVWDDETRNADLVKSLCGIATPALDELTQEELAGFIRRALTDLTVEGTARMLQESLLREDGVKKAVKYVDKLFREELKPGRWRQRWMTTGCGWRDDWGMQKYV